MTNETIPDGYVKDARGRLVPKSLVKPIDQLRDQTIERIIGEAKQLQIMLSQYKLRAFADIDAFIATSHEQYGVTVGGRKGNVTLITFNGRYKVLRQVAEFIQFGEQLQAAKELIDQCIVEWSADSSDNLKVLVNEAFQVDKAGNVNTVRVLSLRRYGIKDEKWEQAMQAISDSINVTGSKPYIRLYERIGDSDQYAPISLDLASV
ncbi:DUF3164 family protein [Burkholderia gladioli]|uniref:DUF3164 family protein n=1 Tax=Burkholderia gladioli TaxID=28095 RepID=UPI001641980F|nr:DUF3164 family protein [Burkholderia gladioli]